MALIDELNKISAERQRQQAQILSDEEVYRIMVKELYNSRVIQRIKEAVSRGKTSIEEQFRFEYALDLDLEMQKRINKKGTAIYAYSEFEHEYQIEFLPLFIFEQYSFGGKMIDMTPLGKRVFNDLKKYAQKDGVRLEAIAQYSCDHRNMLDKIKTLMYYPSLGERFSAKNSNMSHGYSSGAVYIKIRYNYG